jgi:Polyketide cyclase / dehydrase and lipid transport
MPDYEGSRLIKVAPGDVFWFVADVRNLPAYVPTVRSASPLPRGRVRVEGQAGEAAYVDDGFLKIDEDRRRLEWRADERNYRGWLEVSDEDGLSRVFVHLTFGVEKIPPADPVVPDEPVRDDKPVLGRDIDDDPISASLDAALDSLHDLIEGRGGKRDIAD